jgi:hypothetical protein
MSSFRSVNTRQSQSQIFSPIQKRQNFTKQNIRQPIRKGTSVASSVYDPEEVQPNIKLSLKQVITLITLRLGKLEVFMNDAKTTNVFSKEETGGLDKDFLMSIVTRLDNMEKMQHNMRVELENIKNAVSQTQDEEIVIELDDQPVIIDILNRLDALNEIIKETNIDETENVETVEPVENTVENVVEDTFPVYDPNVIEPYVKEEPVIETLIQPVQPIQPVQSVQTPQPIATTIEPEVFKTPRKKGRKVSIK